MAKHAKSKGAPPSPGGELADQVFAALAAAGRVPRPEARDLPELTGLLQRGGFIEPQENVLANTYDLLADARRVYGYGNSVVMEATLDSDGPKLYPLRSGTAVEAAAQGLLSNLCVCAAGGKQFPPPDWFVKVLLLAEPLLGRLPAIRTYAQRPVFDADFVLRGPGWHPDAGILIHGPAIEAARFRPPPPDLPVLERLPPRLRALLGGFCFLSGADRANVVGMLVTGLLVNHFVARGKPIVLFDGNQPNLGKSLLARVMGVVFDGREPAQLFYTPDDEELQKRICAVLRDCRTSLLLIDNAKVPSGTCISSPMIESLSMAPDIVLRILGQSATFSRPNDCVWAITMNQTKVSGDLMTRGVPVRLYYEGETKKRTFGGRDPVEYAREHRLEILGELAGLVDHWCQQGRPDGTCPHRCWQWAKVVGGIMGAAGFPEFLSNVDDAAATFNTDLDELAALAEAVAGRPNGPWVVAEDAGGGGDDRGDGPGERCGAALLPTDWETYFRAAQVAVEELDGAKNGRAKAIRIGQFFTPSIGRTVPILAGGRTGTAVAHAVPGRSGQKRYYFELRWDSPPPAESPAEPLPGDFADPVPSAGGADTTKAVGGPEPSSTAPGCPAAGIDTARAIDAPKPVAPLEADPGGNSEQW